MRTTVIVATFVASVLAIFAAIDVHAQNHGPAAGPHCPVATVDLNYIFKKHDGLKAAEERWKRDVQEAESNVKKDRDRYNALGEQLKALRPGTPDYKKKDEEMMALNVSVQTHVQIQKKEFQERKVKLMYAVYLECKDAVKYWADRNGVNLVVQFSGDPVDMNVPQSMANEVGGMIVYQRGVDITPIVLDEVNHPPATTRGNNTNNSATKPGGPAGSVPR